jgi:hypothetical protein
MGAPEVLLRNAVEVGGSIRLKHLRILLWRVPQSSISHYRYCRKFGQGALPCLDLWVDPDCALSSSLEMRPPSYRYYLILKALSRILFRVPSGKFQFAYEEFDSKTGVTLYGSGREEFELRIDLLHQQQHQLPSGKIEFDTLPNRSEFSLQHLQKFQ